MVIGRSVSPLLIARSHPPPVFTLALFLWIHVSSFYVLDDDRLSAVYGRYVLLVCGLSCNFWLTVPFVAQKLLAR